jgi:DTW domain-containing protein YfiP
MCAAVAPLRLSTRVLVFVHRREVHKPTNTARLVPLALEHSEVRVLGRPEDRARLTDVEVAGRRTLLLYPSDDALVLTRELAAGLPLTLVVPDGNWRQASKMARKEGELARLQPVRLPDGLPSRWALRRHPDPLRIGTFEAIARALGILEGLAIQNALERVLELKVERQRRIRPPARAWGLGIGGR